MFVHSTAIMALSAITLVSAQANSASNWTVDPQSVDPGTISTWCDGQQAACIALCVSVTRNDCDWNTLDFKCVCDNDESPDFNKYMDTMPFYVCKEDFDQCIAAHPNDQRGQDNCTTSINDKCPTGDYTKATKIGASETTSSSAAPTSSETAAPQSTQSTSTMPGGAMPTMIGNGAAAVAVGLFAYML